MLIIEWNEVQEALTTLECDVSPAGAHGQFAAMACRGGQAPRDLGLTTSADDSEAWEALRGLLRTTTAKLESADLDFAPMLPDDEQVLWRRLEALGEWAECFAFGLSLAGSFDPKALSQEGRDCLEHLLEISRIDPDDDEAQGAEAEEAYTELVEFLRIAVMTLYVEFRAQHTRH